MYGNIEVYIKYCAVCLKIEYTLRCVEYICSASSALNREDTDTWTLTTLHVLRFYDKMTIILRPKVHRSITHSNYLVTVKTQFIIHIHTRTHARTRNLASKIVRIPSYRRHEKRSRHTHAYRLVKERNTIIVPLIVSF